MASNREGPEAILRFWFAGATSDPAQARARVPFWFEPSPETDKVVEQRFGSTLQQAAAGLLESWAESPASALALVIVLDQFPRNILRGRAEAFAYDDQALRSARRSVERGHLRHLTPAEHVFLLMPYSHSETLEVQREGLRLFEGVLAEAPSSWKGIVEPCLAFAREHHAIVERFGRFPHRNPLLGRRSTPAEEAFLESGGATFGQSRS